MLDPSNDFNSPCYDDTFRRNYFFKEYKNFTEYFIELDYWIMREAFVSRIGAALNLDQTHYDDGKDGEKIFRDISAAESALLSARGYFLADETIDSGTSKFGDIYHVTELYAYAPITNGSPTVFSTWNTEVVNFPDLVDYDRNYSKKYLGGEVEYLAGLDEIAFESDELTIGDEFYIDRPESSQGTSISYACRSSMLSVYRREGRKVYAKSSQFVNPYSGNTYTAKSVIDAGKPVYIKCAYKKYAARSLQVSIRKDTTFHTGRPSASERFFPVDALTGIESAQLDSGTQPTYAEYRQMMSNGTEVHSAPSTVEEIYRGLWKKTDFFTAAK